MDREPRDHFTRSHYDAHHVKGPVAFLNPTQRYHPVGAAARPLHGGPSEGAGAGPGQSQAHGATGLEAPVGIYHVWKSRDNRKGRHCATMTAASMAKAGVDAPKPTNTWAQTRRGVMRMFVRFPVWDVSYDVATVFTLGSVIWVINAFFVWLPLAAPSTEFPGESATGGGVTACIGATVFELGSVLLMLEAVNENRSYCFGWALEEAIESRGLLLRPRHNSCQHHHVGRSASIAATRRAQGDDSSGPLVDGAEAGLGDGPGDLGMVGAGRRWSWWPTWRELSTHYFRDIGFLACLSQMLGATIFWISGFTGLPPILNSLPTPVENGVFWLPQVVGGCGFIVSSLLFMLEVQDKWYIPAPKVLGWHIGLWNLVGALGFTLCGAFGFAIDKDGMEYASTLSTFIGSWAFLVRLAWLTHPPTLAHTNPRYIYASCLLRDSTRGTRKG
ncbi:hypothetical protein GQ53DRAFT_848172 [Thozetella sp. PMI_491]|nr:hypothetical protein GQ53DRAFT_848172 [Thozetella sp. PMI_491]